MRGRHDRSLGRIRFGFSRGLLGCADLTSPTQETTPVAADESKKKKPIDEDDERDEDEQDEQEDEAADEEESDSDSAEDSDDEDEDEKDSDEDEEDSDEDEEDSDEDSDDEDEDEDEKDSDEDEEDATSKDDEDDEDEEASTSNEADDDEDEADDDDEEEVAASPEAIAKRVEALGEEDESERIARDEEKKLAERRRKLKKRGGKSGLALAASKRLKKIGRNAQATKTKRRVPAAVEAADPLLERTAKLGDWANKNAKTVWTIAGIAVAGLLIFAGYNYYQKSRSQAASVELAAAIKDEHAKIGEPPKDDDDDTEHYFKTVDDRREAALSKYRNVSSKFAGTGAATLARLGEGSLLLDKRDWEGAVTAFEDVKGSPLAAADTEVKGRALEGLGFARELQAQLKPDAKAKALDDALAAFKALEALDVPGFKELGMYHQARVLEAKGDLDKAKEVLHALHDRFAQPDHGRQMDIIGIAADDRLRRLDPTALPPKRVNYGANGHPQLSPEILNQLPPELRAKLMGGGGE
jgi:hypothetical protein